jgi:hypothetical protein
MRQVEAGAKEQAAFLTRERQLNENAVKLARELEGKNKVIGGRP